MKNAVATSSYNDTYFGVTPVWLVPFKTSRRGEKVTRYRWESGKAVHCGFAAGGFSSPEAAIRAANAHRLMGPVETAA